MITDVEVLKYLKYLNNNGILLWVEDSSLKYKVTKNSLDNNWIDVVKQNKKSFINAIKSKTESVFSLNSIQKAYIVGKDQDCELGGINCQYYIEYKLKDIDIKRLEDIINEVIKNNDALRCLIMDNEKFFIFDTFPRYKIKIHNKNNELMRKEISNKDYSYYDWPLFDFYIGTDKSQEYKILYFVFNCITLDAWSAKKMLEEVFEIYFNNKTIENNKYSLRTYKLNEDKFYDKQLDEESSRYWKNEMLKEYNFPQLNYKKRFSEVNNLDFNRIEYSFSIKETQTLYQKVKKSMYTPAMFIYSSFLRLLSDFSSQEKLSIVLTTNGRKIMRDIEGDILGEFSNVAVLNYKRHKTFNQDMEYIREKVWKILEYREYDGMNITNLISKNERGKAVLPIVVTSMLDGRLEKNQSLNNHVSNLDEIFAISKTPQVAIDHHARDDKGYLMLSWDYVVEVFNEEEIKRMFSTYITFIKDIISSEN